MVKRKAQSSIEFVIILIAVLFFFLSMLFVLQQNLAQKNFEKRDLIIKDLASNVRDEINLASTSSDGYSRNFKLPQDILGLDYSIHIINDLVYLNTSDGRHAVSFPIVNISGSVIKGVNRISKNNGQIYMNS